MKGVIQSMSLALDGDLRVTVQVPRHHLEELDGLRESPLSIEVKKWREKRSRDANSLCWSLCRDIAKAMPTPHTDVEIYRRAIRDVGEFEHLPIKEVAVETFSQRWASKGLGWFVDIVDDSKLKGYKLVKAYYGSSTYTTAEMSRLLDYLVDEAVQMGIPLLASKRELDEAKRKWGEDA